jgi:poly(3-hydroxybutyrate) depolymerase
VACIAAHHPVDAKRVFVGGISIGGTFVNFLLRHHPDVFAGGIVGSGNFILTEPPDPEPLGAMTVIVAWGGDGDHWTGCPDGRMGEQFEGVPGCASVDFVQDAHDAAAFYDGQDGVAMLACTEDLGHIWNAGATAYWADLLAARPKGTTEPIEVGSPPGKLSCSTEVPT